MVLLILVGAFLGWPFLQGPQESKSAEARAALGTLKDRLRAKFIQNGNKLDPSWRLGDLVNTAELTGKYYAAADYEIVGPITHDLTLLRARANTVTGAPQVTMTVTNLSAGAATMTSP